ncbi:hypothetical protein ABNF97_29145 [Plantactinospora sp. B6F1]|uniref:hypothetical protein n=1 Tax=Plantactinospora sp. B6F1 TaxID=3158971 RepID=UPI0032D9A000
MTLERTYRWLLACYPWEHRRQYEDEMLGVLLDDGGPQRSRPRARDALDLLFGALQARARCTVTRLSDQPWRDAAAVLGLLAPLAMLAYAARLVLLNFTLAVQSGHWEHFDEGSWYYSWPPVVAWAAVVAMAAVGGRRTAAALAWAAAALEAARAADAYATYLFFNSWPVALAVVAAAALTVAALRPVAFLGPRRLALLTGAALLVTGAPTITFILVSRWRWEWAYTGNLRTNWIFTNNVTYLEAVLLSAGFTLGALAVVRTPAPLRRRLLALLAPVGATLLITRVGIQNWMFNGLPLGLNLTQWLALALTPPLTVAVAVAAVHRRERTLRLLALGRAADRQSTAGPGTML